MGEDASGHSVNLDDVSQPARLFVPRETLPHLQRNKGLWPRVKNPEVATGKPLPGVIREGASGGDPMAALASLFVGSIMDDTKAENLLPGEFQVTVVDTYADATTAIRLHGIFGV